VKHWVYAPSSSANMVSAKEMGRNEGGHWSGSGVINRSQRSTDSDIGPHLTYNRQHRTSRYSGTWSLKL
jgi:hypothetical protein